MKCKRGGYSKLKKKELKTFLKSKKALAIPLTYLILFVSLLAVISATYSFAIIKISARGTVLNISVAKQNLFAVDDAVRSIAWSQGASCVVYMDDCASVLQISQTAKTLLINFTDNQTFHSTVFNGALGKISYKLESSEYSYENLFIRGDSRAIINQSTFSMTQLYFSVSDNEQRLTLSYRPFATAALIGTSEGKPLNLIRIHIINLNSSQNLVLTEKFYLKLTSTNITTISREYVFNTSVSSLALKTVLDETSTTVWLPITSNEDGAAVKLEIVLCNIKIQLGEV